MIWHYEFNSKEKKREEGREGERERCKVVIYVHIYIHMDLTREQSWVPVVTPPIERAPSFRYSGLWGFLRGAFCFACCHEYLRSVNAANARSASSRSLCICCLVANRSSGLSILARREPTRRAQTQPDSRNIYRLYLRTWIESSTNETLE